jgi:hypothetical protein
MPLEKWFRDDLHSSSDTGSTRRWDGSAVQRQAPIPPQTTSLLTRAPKTWYTREVVPAQLQEAIRAAGQPCRSAPAEL